VTLTFLLTAGQIHGGTFKSHNSNADILKHAHWSLYCCTFLDFTILGEVLRMMQKQKEYWAIVAATPNFRIKNDTQYKKIARMLHYKYGGGLTGPILARVEGKLVPFCVKALAILHGISDMNEVRCCCTISWQILTQRKFSFFPHCHDTSFFPRNEKRSLHSHTVLCFWCCRICCCRWSNTFIHTIQGKNSTRNSGFCALTNKKKLSTFRCR